MKLIVAGGRDFTDIEHMDRVIKSLGSNGFIDTDEPQLVCGMARGADLTAYDLWRLYYMLPIKKFYADWNLYPRAGGIYRNMYMGDYADKLIAFWDGKSRGTKHMIQYMQSLNKPVHIENY